MDREELLAYAAAYTGRGDDCGRLARMVVESTPPINADAAHRCISPACGTDCSDCSGALKPAAIFRYAKRYAYLRERSLDAIKSGGVFAGMTPDNVVLNGDDLDTEIDAALALLPNAGNERPNGSAR